MARTGTRTFKRAYPKRRRPRTKRKRKTSQLVTKTQARRMLAEQGQQAYVTTYLCFNDNISGNIYFNCARQFDNVSALSYYSRGIMLDLSDCPNTGTQSSLESGHSHTGALNAISVVKKQSPSSGAPATYALPQHTSAVMDGNKFYQHGVWWDLLFRNPDTSGTYRLKMYIVKAKEKREDILNFFQGMAAPILPGWVTVLDKREFVLGQKNNPMIEASNVATTSGYLSVNSYIKTAEQEYQTNVLSTANSVATTEGHVFCLITYNRIVTEDEAAAADTQPLDIMGYFRTRITDSE